MTSQPPPPTDIASDLQKLQFDYAWKWFAYHADQRVKMFNFMLIVLGIFATAIVSAIANHLQSGFTAVLCFVAASVAFIFSLLDGRNRVLVWLWAEVLIYLVKGTVFCGCKRFTDPVQKTILLGIL